MPAYAFFDTLDVTDPATFEVYKAAVAPVVRQYGGRYVALGGRFEVAEGGWRPVYPVLIEFPDYNRLRRWYHSEDYRDLKAMRLASGKFNAVLIEGLSGS